VEVEWKSTSSSRIEGMCDSEEYDFCETHAAGHRLSRNRHRSRRDYRDMLVVMFPTTE